MSVAPAKSPSRPVNGASAKPAVVPTRKSRRTPSATSTASSDEEYEIQLRLFASDANPPVFRTIKRRCSDRRDYPMVARWNYVVSKRLRLTASPVGAGLDELHALVADYLKDRPNESHENFIRDLARAEVIEVGIPYKTERVGWAARLFPWESALSIITRQYRQRSLVVVRHLDVAGRSPAVKTPGANPRVLVVRSTPGELAKSFDFRSESALVKFKLGGTAATFTDLDTPTKQEVATQIRTRRPAIVHLAVIDTHGIGISQPELLKGAWARPAAENETREGILLRGDAVPYSALDAEETGRLVTAEGTHAPTLVSYATCYSATRLAPMAVAFGAHAAIGFHEGLADSVSEAFFGALYQTWHDEQWDLLKAFQVALAVVRGQPESGRSGVALWSAVSLVLGREKRSLARRVEPRALKPQAREMLRLDDANVRDVFTVACAPLQKVNYCSLHNGRDLFTEFSVKKNAPGLTPPVEVRVELTAENESAAWRQSLAFGDSPGSESLANRVRVPLGARALRRVQESTRSSLFVEVRCGAHVLLQQSSQVTLLPVDEWRDTDDDRRWLPSFVLPRDPAVRQIMAAADRYLRALCDDSAAGFDGYQQAAEWPEIVDVQARAIWCALLYDFRLRYINPPPTYTKTDNGIAQRLRTPSQIIEEGRGTCIDLALLFAGCLEYVGLYPVIYLISGHAFPGWWRSEAAYQKFAGFSYVNVAAGRDEEMAKQLVSRDNFAQWMVTGNTGFRELVTPLREGNLAALESTLLCSSGAFEAALQQGRENLADAEIFDALINIQRAREGDDPVTPLPIVGGIAVMTGPPALADGTHSNS